MSLERRMNKWKELIFRGKGSPRPDVSYKQFVYCEGEITRKVGESSVSGR